MSASFKRLAGGLALLLSIAALAFMATGSAFAYNTATDLQSTSSNGGPLDQAGSLSVISLNVASLETAVASFTFTSSSLVSAPVGAAAVTASSVTSIRTMYQQWRHTTQNDWFYVYAQNGATSLTAPVWDYYYYSPGRGYTRINSTASLSNSNPNGVASGGPNVAAASQVFLGTGSTNPAFQIDSMQAQTSPSGQCTGTAGSCQASFGVTLRWGIAQQGFRTGSMIIQEAVESFPIPTSSLSTPTVYYDSWKPITGSDVSSTVALNDNAPVQSASGVTNASGARNVGTASAYSSAQTVTDRDADISSGQLIWVFTSGTQTGQWFQAGVYIARNTGGYSETTRSDSSAPSGQEFYQSWNEAMISQTLGSQMTTNYFQSLNATVAGTPVSNDAAGSSGTGFNNITVTYNYIYSSLARGNVTLWGRGEDWHGKSSGNVQVGTQTIS